MIPCGYPEVSVCNVYYALWNSATMNLDAVNIPCTVCHFEYPETIVMQYTQETSLDIPLSVTLDPLHTLYVWIIKFKKHYWRSSDMHNLTEISYTWTVTSLWRETPIDYNPAGSHTQCKDFSLHLPSTLGYYCCSQSSIIILLGTTVAVRLL